MTRPWSPARTPTFWLMLAVLGLGCVGVFLLLGLSVGVAPRSAAATIPLLAVYAFASLLLIRHLDHLARRLWWLVAMALGWGATGAAAVGDGAGLFLDNILAKLIDPWFAASWGDAIVAPIAEELGKAAGIALLLLVARPHLRTVMAGAAYGAIIGVGFAALEDATYVLGAADETLPDNGPEALRVLALRVAVPGLVSHPLFAAVTGAGIAYFAVRVDRSRGRRFAVLGAAFGLAGLMHAAVNSPLASLASDALDRLPGFAVLTGYFLVVYAPAAVAMRWLASVRRLEAIQLTERLTDPAGAAVTEAEAATLASTRLRARAVRELRRAYGVAAARAARRVQRAQLRFVDLPADPVRPASVAPTVGGPGPVHPSPVADVPVGWQPQPYQSAPYQPAPYSPVGWQPVPVRPTPVQRARAELAAARESLARVTGSASVPAPSATAAPVPAWLVWGGLGLAVVGLVHWAAVLLAALLAAVPLAMSWRRRQPIADRLLWMVVAVCASGYLWLASALVVLLFPGH